MVLYLLQCTLASRAWQLVWSNWSTKTVGRAFVSTFGTHQARIILCVSWNFRKGSVLTIQFYTPGCFFMIPYQPKWIIPSQYKSLCFACTLSKALHVPFSIQNTSAALYTTPMEKCTCSTFCSNRRHLPIDLWRYIGLTKTLLPGIRKNLQQATACMSPVVQCVRLGCDRKLHLFAPLKSLIIQKDFCDTSNVDFSNFHLRIAPAFVSIQHEIRWSTASDTPISVYTSPIHCNMRANFVSSIWNRPSFSIEWDWSPLTSSNKTCTLFIKEWPIPFSDETMSDFDFVIYVHFNRQYFPL